MPKEVKLAPTDLIQRYQLERYRGKVTRHTCPQCGKLNSFVRYVDVTDGSYIGDDIGRCNRESKCGYHNPPNTKNIDTDKSLMVSATEADQKYIEPDIYNYLNSSYLIKYNKTFKNNFIEFLLNNFDTNKVVRILDRYHIGGGYHWRGSTIFWQIDQNLKVRTGKVMLYNKDTCKRVKEPYNHISWVHTPKYKDEGLGYNVDFNLRQCFFGEHLLTTMSNIKEINVVEAEKTAIICSIERPEKVFVATGGLQNISESRLLPFKDYKMVFHPDKGKAHTIWETKLQPFRELFDIEVSTFLNKQESVEEGDDLADYIINKL